MSMTSHWNNVKSTTVRLLPFQIAHGAAQMAADEAMLHSAARGVSSFRIYRWSQPTVSLGYFQSHQVVTANPNLERLNYVRRASGGKTLVHHHEITYALALPSNLAGRSALPWLENVHRFFVSILSAHGISARLAEMDEPMSDKEPLCFHHITKGDMLVGSKKIGGSAQRRHRGHLLQHGSMLLARSEYTPTLHGLQELSGRTLPEELILEELPKRLADKMGWTLTAGEWTPDESLLIKELTAGKYGSTEWNEKR